MSIVMAAIAAGAGDSWLRPVSLRLENGNPAQSNPAAATTPAPNSTPISTPGPAPAKPATPSAGPSSQPAQKSAALDPDSLPAHITIEQGRALFEQGVMFVDAREQHERDEGWITGSIHLTAGMMGEAKLPDEFNQLDSAAPVVIYCAGGSCDASENLAILLKQAGFNRLHVLHDGYPAWKAAGLPVEMPGGKK